MKKQPEEAVTLERSASSYRSSRSRIIPSNFTRSQTPSRVPDEIPGRSPTGISSPGARHARTRTGVFSLLRSFFHLPKCRWLLSLPSPSSTGRKFTGTLFGHRKGHVTFAVQEDPRSDPVLLVELAVSTSTLVKEMTSGLVRIALECAKAARGESDSPKLSQEPTWTMYCNGRKTGYALSRACSEFDWFVLNTVQSVSVGAGVIPDPDDDRKKGSPEGELLYMRAKFERVVGNRDSEAFYMLNPEGNGGPELSVFLLRL